MGSHEFAKKIEAEVRQAFGKISTKKAANQKSIAQPPRDLPINLFKVKLYKQLLKLERKGKGKKLSSYIRERDGLVWSDNHREAAYVLMRLIIGPGSSFALSKQRERLTAEIGLAQLNCIEAKYLLAFLYEVGSEPLIRAAWKQREIFAWAKKYRTDRLI